MTLKSPFPPCFRCAGVLLLASAAFAQPAAAALFAVGTGPGCTHGTVQAALDAAEASAGADEIRVSRSLGYTAQALVLTTGQMLDLSGGFASCGQADSDGIFSIIDGAGGATEPVMRITVNSGGVVRLRYLTIRGGDEDGGGKGGGIYFKGNGSLQLRDSGIINNLAGHGGGIYAEGTGSDAGLIIGNNVTISGNTARGNGGGVFAEGLRMTMRDADSLIAFNEAEGSLSSGTGYGGGLVVNPKSDLHATATVASTGVGALGAIHGNRARFGGGVAVLGESGIDAPPSAFLRMYTVDPARPVAIRDNFASIAGGGLHLQPLLDSGLSSAFADLWNASIEDNSAPDGAAVFLGSTTGFPNTTRGGLLDFNLGAQPSGAAPCPLAAPCGRIAGNRAEDGNAQPTGGAVIRMLEDSQFYVTNGFDHSPSNQSGIVIEHNLGGRLFDLEGGEDRVHLFLRNSLIVDNLLSQELIRAQDEPQVAIEDSTIAGNSIGAAHVLAVSDEVFIRRSILWQPGKTSLVCSGCARTVESTFAVEVTSLGGGPGAVAVPSPRFIDPARSDFRLRAASPAIDYTAPIPGDDRDVHGLPRDQRLAGVPRFPGQVRDLGAFERPALSPLVLNADFAGDLNLWTTPAGHFSVYDSDNAPSSAPGSGSARVSGNAAVARMLGSFQCIHLPGPGTYRLNGWGHSQGINASQRNALSLLWEFRPDGGEDCIDGPITVSGEHYLNGLSVWTSPADPSTIVIPEAQWNHNSSLTILLAVYPNGITLDFNGWFDDITLELDVDPTPGSGLPFADGFEDL